jgi:hypothetical protein
MTAMLGLTRRIRATTQVLILLTKGNDTARQLADGDTGKIPYDHPYRDNTDAPSVYAVRIIYDGEWSGTYDSAARLRSVDGSGTKTFTVDGDPIRYQYDAHKRDGCTGTLTIQILKNEVVKGNRQAPRMASHRSCDRLNRTRTRFFYPDS